MASFISPPGPITASFIPPTELEEIKKAVRVEMRENMDKQGRIIKKQHRGLVGLGLFAAALLASTIGLAVVHAEHLKHCPAMDGTEVSDVPQAPPVGRRSAAFVVVPVTAGASKAPFHITNGTEGGSPSGPPSTEEDKMCDPGSVWGGMDLDHLNHGYMPLMQKALSVSDPGMAGEITDYYHTALQSVFRCGVSMELGQLELVDACKSGYTGTGDDVECDEGGSYGGSAEDEA